MEGLAKRDRAVLAADTSASGEPMATLLDRFGAKIKGILSCFDRVIIQGTVPEFCYAGAMMGYLTAHNIRFFDFAQWAKIQRDRLRTHFETLAAAEGLTIEYLKKARGLRKEDRVRAILAQRGTAPGLVHIFTVLESCTSYQPWHDKSTHRTLLKPDSGKCLHYYVYFIDPDFGLCYLRVPTWCPFRLQFYFNGHNWLATQLSRRGIAYELIDNAFVDLGDFQSAQRLADQFAVRHLHAALDRFARRFCPVLKMLGVSVHWSLMQVEYSSDIVFRDAHTLPGLYERLLHTALHCVKLDQVATFLGHKLTGNFQGELGTDLRRRREGTRIKHHMGPASIKMYDKFNRVLRIETTTNDVAFFRHYRMVEQHDGQRLMKLAAVRKTIYSLYPDLRALLLAANQRYIEFINALDDPSAGVKELRKVCEPTRDNGRTYRGLNFFSAPDQALLQHLTRGEFCISGWRNRDLRQLTGCTTAQISHLFKRLRLHGLIKKIGRTYKYYLSEFGRRVILTGLKLTELVLIPALAPDPLPSP
jgi:hypothetical protein